MRSIKLFWRYLIIVIIISFLLGILSSKLIFADIVNTKMIIDENGINSIGSIIKNSNPWYPGYSESNILSIKNNLGRKVNIENIGMNIELFKNNEELNYADSSYIDFLNNMKIKVEYRNPITKIVHGDVFEGTFNEFKDKINTSIGLNKNDDIDLIYTILMSKDSSINISGITSKIDFTIKVSEGFEQDITKPNYHTISVVNNKIQDEEIPEITALEDEEEHWSHDCIKALLDNGIVEGYDDGTIKPDRKIIRAEAAVLIGRALKINPDNDNNFDYYIDQIPEFARGHIIALTKLGILEGYDDKSFKPLRPITREEMTKALSKAFKIKLDGDLKLQFEDKSEISNWALLYVKSGIQNKYIEGYPDNTFKPKRLITRGESFTLVCKLTKLHQTHKIKEE